MATTSYATRFTCCLSCIRRITGTDISQLCFPFYRQLRGKKKSVIRPTTIKDAKMDDVLGVKSKLLLAQKASEIMETSLPPNIIFYKAPISNPEPEAPIHKRPSRLRRAASSAAAELEAASEPVPKPVRPPLTYTFGSVSTTDIAESIKSLLSGTSEGSKIVIGPEDVTIIQDQNKEFAHRDKGIEGDRLKVLGDFPVEVRVKGAEAVIRRTVKVKAQDVNQAELLATSMTAGES